MKFEGWEIDVDLDGAAIHYDANIELIKVAFISSLKKLVFDCDFFPREQDCIAPDISKEDRYALDKHTFNSIDVMVLLNVVFYPNEKKIKFTLE